MALGSSVGYVVDEVNVLDVAEGLMTELGSTVFEGFVELNVDLEIMLEPGIELEL